MTIAEPTDAFDDQTDVWHAFQILWDIESGEDTEVSDDDRENHISTILEWWVSCNSDVRDKQTN